MCILGANRAIARRTEAPYPPSTPARQPLAMSTVMATSIFSLGRITTMTIKPSPVSTMVAQLAIHPTTAPISPDLAYTKFCTADLNEDGLDDAVSVSHYNGVDYATETRIYQGGPLGLFSRCAHPLESSGSRDVALVDLDNDGNTDIYLPAFWGSFESHIYWGSANGIFDVNLRTTFINGLAEKAIVTDVDQDGQSDVLLPSDGGIDHIRYGNGRDYSTAIALESDHAVELAAADLDQDGDTDIVICHHRSALGAEYNPDSVIWWNEGGLSPDNISLLRVTVAMTSSSRTSTPMVI